MVFPRARGLCRLSPVPADGWSFPTLSLHSLRMRLDLYPAVPNGCACPFLPHRPRPCVTGNTLGEPEVSLSCNFSREQFFEAAVIRYLQAPTLASGLSHLKSRVYVFELNARVGGCELPIGFGVMLV